MDDIAFKKKQMHSGWWRLSRDTISLLNLRYFSFFLWDFLLSYPPSNALQKSSNAISSIITLLAFNFREWVVRKILSGFNYANERFEKFRLDGSRKTVFERFNFAKMAKFTIINPNKVTSVKGSKPLKKLCENIWIKDTEYIYHWFSSDSIPNNQWFIKTRWCYPKIKFCIEDH